MIVKKWSWTEEDEEDEEDEVCLSDGGFRKSMSI